MAGFGRIAGGHTGAERAAAHKARGRTIERRQCEDPKRRIRFEKNTPRWLRFYMGAAAFPAKWADSHIEMIENAEAAAQSGTGAAVAAPRGDGKTTVFRGVAVNLVARGLIRFPVLAGWKHVDATAALAAWLRMLCESPEFHADYPELTQPFEISTHALALKSLMWAGDPPVKIGASVNNMHKMIILPDSIGAIATRSVQGDVKGLSATLPDGTVLRPDLLLLDDAQDPKRADNPTAVAKTVDSIENVFMGMAGPQKRLTTFAACTVEAEDDVSCHLLNRPGWKSTRISRIKTWPGGGVGGEWPLAVDHPQRCLWDEWNRIMIEDGQKKANTYFRKNRKRLIRGMEVTWRYRFDKDRDVCSFDAAMYDYYDKGPDVFSRAQQNLPIKRKHSVYSLTPELIQSRADKDRAPGIVPDWAVKVVAVTDVNPSYALSTTITAFGKDQLSAVLWYGLYKKQPLPCTKDMTEAEKRKRIYEALAAHGAEIAALPCRPNLWVIDGGGSPEGTVIDLSVNAPKICGLETVCAFGRGWKNYRATGKLKIIKGEQWHRTVESRLKQWVIWHADYWRENAQKGWTGAPGGPGSCSLPRGRHDDFAAQICREQLVGKDDIGGRTVWIWETVSGPHDYGDCMAMAYMGAAMCGVGTGGYVEVRSRKKFSQKDLNRR